MPGVLSLSLFLPPSLSLSFSLALFPASSLMQRLPDATGHARQPELCRPRCWHSVGHSWRGSVWLCPRIWLVYHDGCRLLQAWLCDAAARGIQLPAHSWQHGLYSFHGREQHGHGRLWVRARLRLVDLDWHAVLQARFHHTGVGGGRLPGELRQHGVHCSRSACSRDRTRRLRLYAGHWMVRLNRSRLLQAWLEHATERARDVPGRVRQHRLQQRQHRWLRLSGGHGVVCHNRNRLL